MKALHTYLICLFLVTATTVSAQVDPNSLPAVPDPLPAVAVAPSPGNPTSTDNLRLILSGTWPDGCPPEAFAVSVRDESLLDVDRAGSIFIDMILPGADDCADIVCAQVLTDWQGTATVGRLDPGRYLIFVSAIGCAAISPYEEIGEVTVGLSTGGPPQDGGRPRLEPGAFVVSLAGPSGATAGVVVCGNTADFSGSVLVSFFNSIGGTHETSNCADGAPVSLPMASAQWIDTRTTALGVLFNDCGTLREGERGCVLFDADGGGTYNLVGADMLSSPVGPAGEFDFGDRVRVHGALQITGPRTATAELCPAQTGDIHGAVLTLCAPLGGAPGEPCSEDTFVFEPIGYGTWRVLLIPGTNCPDGPRPLSGCTPVSVGTTEGQEFFAAATPLPGVGGTWDATFEPADPANPEAGTFEVCLTVEGLDPGDFTPGRPIEIGRLVFDAVLLPPE